MSRGLGDVYKRQTLRCTVRRSKMSIDAIIMAILSYGFFVGGFVYGLIKVLQSDRKSKKA